MRRFETGATRSSDAMRDDPEGYLSPLVIDRYNEYMTKHRQQQDGSIRESDNWQKGMPLASYVKGMWRHFLHLWTRHRGYPVRDPEAAADIQEDLCAIIFNAQGYLHSLLVDELGRGDAASCRNAGELARSKAVVFRSNEWTVDPTQWDGSADCKCCEDGTANI